MKLTVVAEACDRSETAHYRELSRRGHRVHVLLDRNCDPGNLFTGSEVTREHITVRHRMDRAAARDLRGRLRSGRPDVVYAPSNRTLAATLAAARGLDCAVVGYRGTIGHLSRLDPASWLTYFHPRLDGIVCVTGAVEDYLRRMRIKASLVTAYKGFDVRWFDGPKADLAPFGLPEDAFVVGFTGNVRPVKGVDVLLRAIATLPSSSALRLLLVGDVRCKRVRRMLEEERYAARVHAVGFREDAARLSGACDAFVMPSIEREGIARAVVEAMAQGVPAVVSRVGGMPEVVEDGVSGLVVPPKDPGALAEAFLSLEADPELRRSLGAAARERIATRFTVDRAADTLEGFFSGLAGR